MQILGTVGLALLVGGTLVGIACMIGADDGFWAGVGFLVGVVGGTALLTLLMGMADGSIG
jgi:hypothetical protein